MDENRPPARPGPPARDEFDAIYRAAPPWDIGRPQPAFVALAEAGRLVGRVLDSGCGTGEHTLMAARFGHESVGVDFAPTAVALARAKLALTGPLAAAPSHPGPAGTPAGDPRPAAGFVVGDVRDLPGLSLGFFDTIIDSGVFHVFDDTDRPAYVSSLHAVLHPGGRLLLLCFSEREPGQWGPRRVTQQDLRAAFAPGWTIESIAASAFDIRTPGPDSPSLARAWLADIRRD